MKSRFTITITDVYESKHYLLHQIIKKIVLYFILSIVLLIVFGSFFIFFLMHEVDTLQTKKEALEHGYLKLERSKNKLEKEISIKAKKYDAIKDKVSNMEELIGLTPNSAQKIDTRLKNIKLTTVQEESLLDNIPSGNVLPNMIVTSKFGWRTNPILKRREFHKGIDLKAKRKTPIRAPANGVVEFAGFSKGSGYGNLLIIDHNYGFKTMYGHLSKKMVVKAGQFVKKGEIVGYTGDSGLSTGPHLHYEIRFIVRPLNPINFLRWNKDNFKEIFKKEKRVPWESLINMINNQLLHQK